MTAAAIVLFGDARGERAGPRRPLVGWILQRPGSSGYGRKWMRVNSGAQPW